MKSLPAFRALLALPVVLAATFALASTLLFITAISAFSEIVAQPSVIPANAYDYPDNPGVYLLNGKVFTPITDSYFSGPANVSILVFEPWIADPKTDISKYDLRNWRDVDWNDIKKTPGVPAVANRVENHPDMVMIVPDQPLASGLYSLSSGFVRMDLQFGVETPDAVAFWKSMVQDHPTAWQVYSHLGALLYTQGRVSEAGPQFAKAVELNPQNPESHNNLALVLQRQGKIDEAIKQYELAAKLRDDSSMVTNLANAYLQARRYDDAIKTYRHALDLNLTNAPDHCCLGDALMQQGKLDDAIAEFRLAIKINPNLQQAHTDLDQASRMLAGKQ